MTRKQLSIAAGIAALALALTGCSGQSASPGAGDDTGEAGQAEQLSVTYLTSFNQFGRDAYVYVAQEQGFFEEAGFTVDIQPGTGTVDVLKLVASGKADFGVGDFQAGALTIANEGLPAQIVSSIHDRSLAAIATAEGYGIETPADLEGKRIADQPGSVNEVLFPVYAEAAGIDASKVEFVPSQPPALPQLLASKQVDAIGQFVVAGGLIKGATGADTVFLPFSDYLDDLYGNALFVGTKLIESDPDAVARFNEALHRGLQYTIDHPEEAAKILNKIQPTQEVAVAQGEITAMAPYVGDTSANGKLDPKRVDAILALLNDGGAFTKAPNADAIVTYEIAK